MPLNLRQVAFVAQKLEPVLDDLREIFDLNVCYVDPEVAEFGLENSLLPVGTNFIEVVAPIRPGTAGGRYLERRNGDGGYMVITQADGRDDQYSRHSGDPSMPAQCPHTGCDRQTAASGPPDPCLGNMVIRSGLVSSILALGGRTSGNLYGFSASWCVGTHRR